jgi:hypothetical protein
VARARCEPPARLFFAERVSGAPQRSAPLRVTSADVLAAAELLGVKHVVNRPLSDD